MQTVANDMYWNHSYVLKGLSAAVKLRSGVCEVLPVYAKQCIRCKAFPGDWPLAAATYISYTAYTLLDSILGRIHE